VNAVGIALQWAKKQNPLNKMRLPTHQQSLAALACILTLVFLPILLFWQGIGGHYLLDDVSNLSGLGYQGGIHSMEALRRFVFDGVASSLGRPVALITFVLDGQDWPTAPYPFKYTNILIHALNTVVLFAVLLKLQQLLDQELQQGLIIAFLGALIWAIHPLQVSTVLYVVQRMTELAALFIFAGLWCYLHGRTLLHHAPRRGYFWLTLGIVLCGLLALLSKENGALLPLLVLVVEFTLLRHLPRPPRWRYWALLFLGAPVLIILFKLLAVLPDHAAQYASRSFTLYERLLSEGRILLDYLGQMLLPYHTPSVHHDDFPLSRGLFSPITTLFAGAIIIAALAAAVSYRKRVPVISFAVLWFFAAHLLESTVIALELYYEHRNYVPLLGPAYAAAHYSYLWLQRKPSVATPLISLVFLAAAITTWNYSDTWSNNENVLAKWAEQHPDSVRTSIEYSATLIMNGKVREGVDKAVELAETQPQHIGAQVLYLALSCVLNHPSKPQYMHLRELAATQPFDATTLPRFHHLLKLINGGQCRMVSPAHIIDLTEQFLKNPYIKSWPDARVSYYLAQSNAHLSLREMPQALSALDNALEARPDIDIALRKIQLLTALHLFDEAEKTLQIAHTADQLRRPLLPSREAELRQVQAYIDAGRAAVQKLQPPQ
jgi:hypothetical protein